MDDATLLSPPKRSPGRARALPDAAVELFPHAGLSSGRLL